jgi:hypothetical protein
MGSAQLYRPNVDDCRQRSLPARAPADRANGLKIAEEWQKLAEQVDVSNALKEGDHDRPRLLCCETLGAFG